MRPFFEPGTPLALYNGVVVPAGNEVLKGVVDQIVFFCTLKKHACPVLARERKGGLFLVWSGIPPLELSGANSELNVSIGSEFFDNWNIEQSLSLDEFLEDCGGRII